MEATLGLILRNLPMVAKAKVLEAAMKQAELFCLKKNEQLLKEQNDYKQYRKRYCHLGMGPDGTLLFCDEGFKKLFGPVRIGDNIIASCQDKEQNKFFRALSALSFKEKRTVSGTYRMPCGPIFAVIAALYDADDNILMYDIITWSVATVNEENRIQNNPIPLASNVTSIYP